MMRIGKKKSFAIKASTLPFRMRRGLVSIIYGFSLFCRRVPLTRLPANDAVGNIFFRTLPTLTPTRGASSSEIRIPYEEHTRIDRGSRRHYRSLHRTVQICLTARQLTYYNTNIVILSLVRINTIYNS